MLVDSSRIPDLHPDFFTQIERLGFEKIATFAASGKPKMIQVQVFRLRTP